MFTYTEYQCLYWQPRVFSLPLPRKFARRAHRGGQDPWVGHVQRQRVRAHRLVLGRKAARPPTACFNAERLQPD